MGKSGVRGTRRVAFIGGFTAAYRTGHVIQTLASRPSLFTVTSREPQWYPRLVPRLRTLLYSFWALRAILGADVVWVNALYHGEPLYGLLRRAAAVAGRRVVVDFYWSAFDSMVLDRGQVPRGSRRARRLLRADRAAMLHSDLVIFLSSAERDYYCDLVDVDPDEVRSAIVPLVVPERPRARLPWVNGESEVPCLAWWGRLGNPLHGLDTILAAIAGLAEAGTGFRVLLFPTGPPDLLSELAEEIGRHGLAGRCDVDTEATMENGLLVRRLVHEVDIALGVFGGTAKAHIVPVNKVVDAMSMGLPCVTGESAAFREALEPGAVAMVAHSDADALAEALTDLLSRRDECRAGGDLGAAQWRRLFSPQVFETSLLAALREDP